jgi:hypothetical protein
MSENENVTVLEAPATPTPEEIAFQRSMDFAFQDEMPRIPPAAEDVSLGNVPRETVVEPPVSTPAIIPETTPPPDVLDEDVFIKQKYGSYGIENGDLLKAALEEYQDLKKKAQTPSEFPFSSEQAKKLAHAINSGDYKAVRSYVEAQESSVDGMTPEQQLKTYLKLQNPRFDDELIQDEYSSLYGVDETDEKYIDNPTLLRKDKLRAEQKRDNDLQNAQKYFTEYKQKAQLPDIQIPTQEPDPDYEAYKASTAKHAEEYQSAIAPAINSLKESDLQTTFKVSDPNGQMDFDVNIVPDPQVFQSTKAHALNFGDFLESFYENGKFNALKFTAFVDKGENFDKYAQSIARQSVNAERKRMVTANTPNLSMQRDHTPPPSPEDEDPFKKQLNMAFSV